MTKPIPPLDLSWLLIESPAGTTHVGAMLMFKKPAGRAPLVREIVEAYRAYPPAPPFNYVPALLGGGVPHFREAARWDPHYHIQYLSLPARASYDDLLRLVADLHEPMLDRDRPLFRCWVIDGVPGGMFAIYTKTHHSVIDGESGVKRLYEGLSTRSACRRPGRTRRRRSSTELATRSARRSHRSRHSTKSRSARCARRSPRSWVRISKAACRSRRTTPRPMSR